MSPSKEPRTSQKPITGEVVISKTSDHPVYELVPNFVPLGSRIPAMIVYYKGHARLLGNRTNVVDVVTDKGVAYAIIRGRVGAKVVRLGVAKP